MTQALYSKEKTEIADEAERIQRAATTAKIGSNGLINLEQQNLENAIKNELNGKEFFIDETEEAFEVYIVDTNRKYTIYKDGTISEHENITLKTEFPGDITCGGTLTGEVTSPFEIDCIEDLVAFSNMTNGTGIIFINDEIAQVTAVTSFENQYVTLKKNLSFSSKASYDDYTRTDFGDVNNDGTISNLFTELTTGTGFLPIAKSGTPFSGTFDGGGYKLSNIHIVLDTSEYVGLFSKVSGTIQNLSTSGNIKGKGIVGGIVGEINGKISKCTNSCNVSANYKLGGIAGHFSEQSSNNTIVDCKNTGNITSLSGDDIGGIIGNTYNISSTTISRCINTGKIIGKQHKTGGIVGSHWHSNIIENCANIGEVSGIAYTGGISGYQWEGRIYNSYNTADIINAENVVGGITGWNGGSIIENCFSIGNISQPSTYRAGAITGYNSGTISNCYYLKNDSININLNGVGQKANNNSSIGYVTVKESFFSQAAANSIGLKQYVSEEDLIINPYNCWIIDGTSRPRLYWE